MTLIFVIAKDLKTLIFGNKKDYNIIYVSAFYMYNISLLQRYLVLRAGF